MSPSAIANAIEGVVFDQSLCDLILPSQDVARFMGGASAPTVDVDQILEWTRCEWHVEVPQVRNLQVIVTPQVAPEFRLEYEQRLLDGSYVPVDGVGVGAARALEGANHEVYVTDDLHLVVMPVGLAAEAAGELVREVTANLRGLLAAEVLPPEGATLSPAPQGLALATEELCPVVAPAFIVTETFGSTATDTSAEVHIDLVSPVVHCVYYLESGDRLILTVSFNQDGADRRWFEATMAAEGREPVAGLGVLAGVAPASYVVFVSDTVRLDVNAGPGDVAAALDQLVPAMVANLQAALG